MALLNLLLLITMIVHITLAGKAKTVREKKPSTPLSLWMIKATPSEESTTTVTKDTSKTEKFSYKYDSYDDKGNWTQRTSYNEKGKPVKVIKRTISYYKD